MAAKIQGIVRNARQTIREQANVAGWAIEGTRRVLDFCPLFERKTTKSVPSKKITVWSFLVEVTKKSSQTLVSAEMAGRTIKGIVRDGDEVVVTGKMDKSRNVFIASQIKSLRTGEKIFPS